MQPVFARITGLPRQGCGIIRNFSIPGIAGLWLLIFVLGPIVAGAQIRINSYTSATDTLFWKHYRSVPEPGKFNLNKITRSGSKNTVRQFLRQEAAEYEVTGIDSTVLTLPPDFERSLFPADLNGDGITDVIFSGNGPGGEEIIRMYLCVRDSFSLIFEDFGYLTSFVREKGKLTAISVCDAGCAGGMVLITREYRIGWEEERPVVIRGKQTAAFLHTETPARMRPAPVQFVTADDSLLLRASATRLNEPYNPSTGMFGNIVARYRHKVRGVIIGEKTAADNKGWLYVETWPDTPPAASVVCEKEGLPPFIRGWIRKEDIEKGK